MILLGFSAVKFSLYKLSFNFRFVLFNCYFAGVAVRHNAYSEVVLPINSNQIAKELEKSF